MKPLTLRTAEGAVQVKHPPVFYLPWALLYFLYFDSAQLHAFSFDLLAQLGTAIGKNFSGFIRVGEEISTELAVFGTRKLNSQLAQIFGVQTQGEDIFTGEVADLHVRDDLIDNLLAFLSLGELLSSVGLFSFIGGEYGTGTLALGAAFGFSCG